MVNKSYLIGYRFQRHVKACLEKEHWNVIIQPRSKFPDMVMWKISKLSDDTYYPIYDVCMVECKVNKYLNKEEKEKGKELLKEKKCSRFLIAYREKRKLKFYELKL